MEAGDYGNLATFFFFGGRKNVINVLQQCLLDLSHWLHINMGGCHPLVCKLHCEAHRLVSDSPIRLLKFSVHFETT